MKRDVRSLYLFTIPVLRHRKQQIRPEDATLRNFAKPLHKPQTTPVPPPPPSSLAGRMLFHFPPHELESRIGIVLGRVTDGRIPFLDELRHAPEKQKRAGFRQSLLGPA